MDYEKAYNEAIERAKQFMSEHPTRAEADLMVALFPELKESEDERIREFLIDLLSHGTWKKDWPFSPAECVAWLEKQKESLHIPEMCKENADSFTDEDERIRKAIIELLKEMGRDDTGESENVKCMIAYLEKQKEQKPVEIHIDNPNIEKFDPDMKITTSDSSADGDELLYVCNKSYKIGDRDGKRDAELKNGL